MNNYFIHIKLLLKRLLLILAVFEVSRLFFFLLNYSHFKPITFFQALSIFFWGLRFDFAAIFYFNILFVFLHLIPGNFKDNKKFQIGLKVLFILVNSLILLTNFIDSEYYHSINKRSTAELFKLFEMGDDVSALLPQYIKDFWYIILAWILVIAATIYFYPKFKKEETPVNTNKPKTYFYQVGIMLLITGFFFTIARGLELKPLRIISALDYTEAKFAPLVLNTPFTILNTISVIPIIERNYFSEKELLNNFNPVIKYNKKESFKKKNIVVIILESFSKEYIGSLNGTKGYTPFLDSLIHQGLVFQKAFANGKRSIEAMPSILCGIPSLMNEAYISSNYGTNKINSIANILKTEGYSSSFFHGGSNGTMGFDMFAKAAGFDEYYGRKEFNNEKEFDGNWGIYDEPFLQFFAQKLNTFKQPFVSSVFTLSSHHPYPVPDKYKNKFKGGDMEIHKSIQYSDYALRKFFETASKMPWYNNTLFVLTADHTFTTTGAFYQNKVGIFNIPIIYFCPGDTSLKGSSNTITQQSDIMPTILDYLNYNKAFLCFGNSALDKTSVHFAANFLDDYYQLIQDNYSLLFDGEKSIALYNLSSDSLLTSNVAEKENLQKEKMENQIKAIIQTYNQRMVGNKLTVK